MYIGVYTESRQNEFLIIKLLMRDPVFDLLFLFSIYLLLILKFRFQNFFFLKVFQHIRFCEQGLAKFFF